MTVIQQTTSDAPEHTPTAIRATGRLEAEHAKLILLTEIWQEKPLVGLLMPVPQKPNSLILLSNPLSKRNDRACRFGTFRHLLLTLRLFSFCSMCSASSCSIGV
jgi:hypothetical protein